MSCPSARIRARARRSSLLSGPATTRSTVVLSELLVTSMTPSNRVTPSTLIPDPSRSKFSSIIWLLPRPAPSTVCANPLSSDSIASSAAASSLMVRMESRVAWVCVNAPEPRIAPPPSAAAPMPSIAFRRESFICVFLMSVLLSVTPVRR